MNEIKQPPRKRTVAYYLGIVLMVMLLNSMLMPALTRRAIKEVDYGTFMTMTENKEISEVDIQSNQIVFSGTDGTIYRTGLMEDPGRTERLHNAGVMEPGPRYMHFPDDDDRGYDEHYFRGLISEQVKLVKKNGVYVEKWVKTYTRNEALDVNNYARCAFKGFRIDLDACEQKLYGETKIQRADTSGRPRRPRGLVSAGIKI